MDATRDLEKDLKSILRDVAKQMNRDLKRQVPQRGQNPYATGALKSRFNIDVRKASSGEWEIFMTYPFYGNYTAFGTRRWSNWREQNGLNIFDREPFSGYRKARAGIRPQNWLSLRRQKSEYESLIEERLGESLEVFVDRLTTIGIRTR
jgi:hypothetical protein